MIHDALPVWGRAIIAVFVMAILIQVLTALPLRRFYRVVSFALREIPNEDRPFDFRV